MQVHAGRRVATRATVTVVALVGLLLTAAVPAAAATTLRLGDRGPAVSEWQGQLNQVQDPDVAVDGIFGPATDRATRAFQQSAGLTVDGIVGPRTRAALGVGSAPPATPRKRTPSGRVTATPTGGALAPPDEAPGTGTPQTESTPAPGSGTPRTKTAPPASGNVPAALRRIAQCESGGNPGAIGGGGTYRGKYQFTRETWRNLGGKGDPARAPEAEQDRLAMKLYSQAGSAPWANCAR